MARLVVGGFCTKFIDRQVSILKILHPLGRNASHPQRFSRDFCLRLSYSIFVLLELRKSCKVAKKFRHLTVFVATKIVEFKNMSQNPSLFHLYLYCGIVLSFSNLASAHRLLPCTAGGAGIQIKVLYGEAPP